MMDKITTNTCVLLDASKSHHGTNINNFNFVKKKSTDTKTQIDGDNFINIPR